MLIAVDIDDVLAEFVFSLVRFHNGKYGTKLSKKDFHSYRLAEVWGGTEEEVNSKMDLFLSSPYFLEIKPVENSVEVIDSLRKKHDLVVITARERRLREQTKEWIHKYFPNAFSLFYFSNNHYTNSTELAYKHEICRELGSDYLIEDSVDYAAQCAPYSKVLLMDQPWNRGLPESDRIRRVGGWREIEQILR